MRRVRPQRLAAALLIGALGACIAAGTLPGGAVRLHLAADTTSTCQPLPAAASTAATPSPSPSPANLCVSVQATQSSVTTGSSVTFNIVVWSQGPAPGVTVVLTVGPAGLTTGFTNCPDTTGNGTPSCKIGDLDIGTAPLMDQLQATVPVPAAATDVSTLIFIATAKAATTPAMSLDPEAWQSVAVSTPKPSPSASASASASASSSKSASASASPSSTATSAQSRTSASPGASPAATPITTLPPVSLAPMPAVGPTTNLLVPSGSIALPAITPGADVTQGSSPAANVQALPVTGTGSPDPNRFTLSIGMPAGTARAIALAALILFFVAIVLIARMLTRNRRANSKAAKTAKTTKAAKTAKATTAAATAAKTAAPAVAETAGQPDVKTDGKLDAKPDSEAEGSPASPGEVTVAR